MSATMSDLLTATNDGTRPQRQKLTATKNIGQTFLQADALVGWPTESAVHFTMFKVDPTKTDAYGNPLKIMGTQSDWKGIRNGTTIEQLQLKAGNDDNYPANTVIVCTNTSAWADDLYGWGTKQHDTLGNHTDIIATTVTSPQITAQNGLALQNGTFTTPAKAINASSLSTPAVKACRVSTLTIGPAESTITFNGERFKTATGMHSNTTNSHRLTCTQTGIYQFNYTLNCGPGFAGGRVIVSAYLRNSSNGLKDNVELYDSTLVAGEPSISFSWVFSMALDDFCVITVFPVGNNLDLYGSAGGDITSNGVSMILTATL